MWDVQSIDALTEIVVSRLLVERADARAVAAALAARLAAETPDLPALALALPFTLAAGAIEEMLGAGPEARRAAQEAWRVAALIGADALALRAAGQGVTGQGVTGQGADAGQGAGPGDSIADLLALWSRGDEVFVLAPGQAVRPSE